MARRLGAEYPLTHNLPTLLVLLEARGVDVAALWDLAEYNPFGVQFRYEALDGFEEPLDRPAAVAQVRRLLDQVAAALAGVPAE